MLTGVGILVLLALPLFSIRLGFGDTGNLKEDKTARKAYDLMAEGFGAGSSGPLFLASTDPAITPDKVKLRRRGTAPPTTTSRSPHPASRSPRARGSGRRTRSAHRRTRRPPISSTGSATPSCQPPVSTSRSAAARAASIDFADYLAGRLPLLIGAVLILSFLLLMIVFRSLLVPLKAVIMNLLSVSAAYGIIVAIFQWGWAKNLFGIGKAGPVEAWIPMMLFAITFGLSMDYEVFLLSRMKEEYDRTGDNAEAVADGLAVTAGSSPPRR